MSGAESDLVGTLLSCLSWLFALLDLALGAVAFARLKTTPAGLLLGCGFALYAVTSIGMKVLRMAAPVDVDDPMSQIVAMHALSTCASTLWLSLIRGRPAPAAEQPRQARRRRPRPRPRGLSAPQPGPVQSRAIPTPALLSSRHSLATPRSDPSSSATA